MNSQVKLITKKMSLVCCDSNCPSFWSLLAEFKISSKRPGPPRSFLISLFCPNH